MSDKTTSGMQGNSNRSSNIEDVLPTILNGEKLKIALDFVAYMRENKMTLRWARFSNAWKASYKGKCICYVRLRGNSDVPSVGHSDTHLWVITPFLLHIDEYEESVIREGLENTVWDNMFYCKRCFPEKYPEGRPCVPGRNIILLGKEIRGICVGRQPVWVWDPGETAINCIKKLLELEQKARAEKTKSTT